MPDRTITVTIREIGDSSYVVLPEALLEHLGAKKGERLIVAEVLAHPWLYDQKRLADPVERISQPSPSRRPGACAYSRA